MSNNKGLTLTMIFHASSANYGESLSNVSVLKKFTAADGHQYTYISRQAIRHNIAEQMGANTAVLTAKGGGDKKVIQYADDETIEDRLELDLFGYMKTNQNNKKKYKTLTRSAPIRISNAVAQSPYQSDYDFLTNLDFAKRYLKSDENKKDKDLSPNIAQSEIDSAFYIYTISIDLDRIGIDDNEDLTIDNDTRAARIDKFLNTVAYLYRDIKGRREDLKPLFAIGGIYEVKNPFFANAVHMNDHTINLETIKDVLDDPEVKDHTESAMIHQIFSNEADIEKALQPLLMPQFFSNLKKKVNDYYANL